MPTRPILVMVVADHALVRTAVTALVATAPDMAVYGDAVTVGEAERMAEAGDPDVVLIDLHLSYGTCIAASRRIRNRRPDTQVILLTAACDADAVFATILSGAAGYLPKQLRGVDLVGSIRTVASGRRLLDAHQVDVLLLGRNDAPLLALMAKGYTDQQLQHELGVEAAVLEPLVGRLLDMAGPSPSPALATAGEIKEPALERTGHASA
ncbi:MAG: response regulator transcription factor [Acidimicrobiales bacterium]